MDFQSIMVYFANGLLTLFFYFQNYFWYIVMFFLFLIVGGLEFKEKQHLYVDDERKVI